MVFAWSNRRRSDPPVTSLIQLKEISLDMIQAAFTSSANPSTVLLIGDSFGILKRIAYALQHSGYTVIWGDSGAIGFSMAESEGPALIVSEIDLPDVSGIEVCRRVKGSFFGSTPVVLVGKTADEAHDSREAIRAGADDYFVTFSDSQFILARLKWLMKRRQARFEVERMINGSDKRDQSGMHSQ